MWVIGFVPNKRERKQRAGVAVVYGAVTAAPGLHGHSAMRRPYQAGGGAARPGSERESEGYKRGGKEEEKEEIKRRRRRGGRVWARPGPGRRWVSRR